jgi:hypothetical protein
MRAIFQIAVLPPTSSSLLLSAALSLLCAGDLRGLVPYYWFLMSKQDPLDRHEMGL